MTLSSLLFAQLLDLHLSRSINRWKGDDRMSKFKQLAEAIKGDLKNFDEQADDLFKERERLRTLGEDTFNRHRQHLASVREGLHAMAAVVDDVAGSNSRGNEEGSDGLSGQSRGGERG